MPFVPVPKDLTRVKSKVAFNLAKRQLVCFGGGALVGVPTYVLARGFIGNDTAVLLMIGPMLPFFLFGIYEKDGQPLEKILGHFIRARFLVPRTRPYRTENLYAALERQNRKEMEAKLVANKAAKNTGKKSAYGKKAARNRKGRSAGRHPAHPGG